MTIQNDLLLRKLDRQQTSRPPIWFMRQAGRYLPDYQILKAKYDFFTRVQTPELVAEITNMPVDQIGVDAAILFSDILVIPQGLGMEVQMLPGKGPFLPNPIASASDVDKLSLEACAEFLTYATPCIQATLDDLNGRVPLIGFCGSPWTLLCYMVEGSGSKNFAKAKAFCLNHPKATAKLLDVLTDACIGFLKQQVAAGVSVVQVFDSWGGILSPDHYAKWSLPYIARINAALKEEVFTILYAKDGWFALKDFAALNPSAIGLTWTMTREMAEAQCGSDMVFQGKLDPSILHSSPAEVKRETLALIKEFEGLHHIVNLGHGIHPNIPVDHVRAFVDTVKSYSF